MPDVRFECSSCSHRLAIDIKASALTISCPECGTALQVPDLQEWMEQANAKMLEYVEALSTGRIYDYVARGDLRDFIIEIGYAPIEADHDGPYDYASAARIKLVMGMNVSFFRECQRWNAEGVPDPLDGYPAQELVRLEKRRAPRDWQSRWIDAGGKLIGGRMIALKTDPIWSAISDFGVPWPPFAIGSGMGLTDVSHRDAVDFHLEPDVISNHPRPSYTAPVIRIEDDRITAYLLAEYEAEHQDEEDE